MKWIDIFIPIFAIICLIYHRSTSLYVYLAISAIIWNGSTLWGVDIDLSKILIFTFILTYGIQSFWSCRGSVPFSGVFYLIIIYSLFCSFIAVAIVNPGDEVSALQHSMFQKFPIRGYIATIYWLMNLSYFALGFYCFKNKENLIKCINTFLTMCYIVSILSAVQFLSYYLFPPLERALSFFANHNFIITAPTELSFFNIYRLSLFCAETRYLGFAMSLGIMITIICKIINLSGIKIQLLSWSKIFLYLAVMLSSASASIIPTFAYGMLIMWVFIKRNANAFSITNDFNKWQLATLIILFFLGLSWIEFKTGFLSPRIDYYISSMTAKDIDQDKENRTNFAYIKVLATNPLPTFVGYGIGNIGFIAYDYLDEKSPDRLSGGILSSRFPLLDLLAGIGILGMSMFILLWFKWSLYIRYHCITMNEPILFFLYYMIIFLLIMLFVLNTFSLIWLFFGIAFALIKHLQIDKGYLPV
jgi:hypothetical protein